MAELLFFGLCIIAVFTLAIRLAPLWGWAAAFAVAAFLYDTGLAHGGFHLPQFGFGVFLLGWLPAFALGALSHPSVRRRVLVEPIFAIVKKILPPISDTEAQALEAGTVGWDAELFSGQPDWEVLRSVPEIELNEEERAFLEGPTEALCEMVDDWQIRHIEREVPKPIWDFIAKNGFLGMLISKDHGGLGFSAQAQSLILGKVASRSPDVATIVMVPNSLGPGELIEKYGTDEQKAYYLPRLARGEEVPCFALTGPTSGSDAAAMRDVGTLCRRKFDGKKTLGVSLDWDKRYITLGPKATLLGLAFRLFDPDHLLGREEDIGITLALVPTDHPGVEIGRRHLPCGSAFSNGPTWGRDVFIPIDWIIGGEAMAGQGWRMLMECLSAGRSISLPASSAAAAKTMLRVTSAYARIRKQFGIAIGRMEGIQEPLARLVEQAYVLESGRAVTAAMVARGEKPAVISALLKYQSTERMRQCVNDAMDIHGGRGICDGPHNYLQATYQMVPIGITVEGANILTRSLITFSQGALRSHPWLYKEINATKNPDEDLGLVAFDGALSGHVSFAMANIFGALFHNMTGGVFANTPPQAGGTAPWYRQLARASRSFALVADLSVTLLGGALKMRQRLAGRMADALSELYLLSCMLKRFEDDGKPTRDQIILDLAARNALYRFWLALQGTIDNFPLPPVRWVLRVLVFPLGMRVRPASDAEGKAVVRMVLEPGDMRDRLTRFIHVSRDVEDPLGILEVAMVKVVAAEAAERKIERAVRKGLIRRFHGLDWIGEAAEKGVIDGEEAALLREVEDLVDRVIAVDHFDAQAVKPHYRTSEASSTDRNTADKNTVAAAE